MYIKAYLYNHAVREQIDHTGALVQLSHRPQGSTRKRHGPVSPSTANCNTATVVYVCGVRVHPPLVRARLTVEVRGYGRAQLVRLGALAHERHPHDRQAERRRDRDLRGVVRLEVLCEGWQVGVSPRAQGGRRGGGGGGGRASQDAGRAPACSRVVPSRPRMRLVVSLSVNSSLPSEPTL